MSNISQAVVRCRQVLNLVPTATQGLRCVRCISINHRVYSLQYTTRSQEQSFPLCHHSKLGSPTQLQVRSFSNQKSFIKDLIENVRQEMTKSKEMKENLKKFRNEAEKLEKSDALQKAREKYEAIESETSKSSDVLKEKMSVIQEKMKETISEAEKSEIGQRSKHIFSELGKTVEKTAESVGKSKENITKSQVFKSVTEGAKAVKSEFDDVTLSRATMYRPPMELRKRQETDAPDKKVEADAEATEMVMHKDSKFYETWQNFKDNNQFVTKMFDMKMKYDESDHVMIRATRAFSDKFSDLFGGLFARTEMSEVLTEIVKMDPTFDKERFIKDCQNELIPNILEALVRGELEILQDWCYEAAFNVLAAPIKQAQTAGYKIESRILDINNVDIVAGKMMEQGPVLVVTFIAQQIMVVRDALGKIKEGDPDKIMKMMYIWAFCRDQTELDPKAAWRLIDLSSQPMSEQWL